MFDARLRAAKDFWFQGSVRVCAALHPTWITAVGFAFGLAAAVAAANRLHLLGLVLFLIGRVCDGLDGAVARATNRQSKLGGYLDLMADFVVYAAIPIGIWWSLKLPVAETALIAMLAAFYVNAASWMLLSAIVERTDGVTTVAMPTGIVEGFETIVFYVLFFLLPAAHIWLFFSFAALVLLSAAQRVIWAIKYIR